MTLADEIRAWAVTRGRAMRQALGLDLRDLRPMGAGKLASLPTDVWNAAKLTEIREEQRPAFAGFLNAAQDVTRAHGRELVVWESLRTLERQAELYLAGRLLPGKRVTKTVSGGNHLWGIAVDLVFRTPDGQPKWPHDAPEVKPWYRGEVLPIAAAHGLSSLLLAIGIDPPHVELPYAARPAEVTGWHRRIKAEWKAFVARDGRLAP